MGWILGCSQREMPMAINLWNTPPTMECLKMSHTSASSTPGQRFMGTTTCGAAREENKEIIPWQKWLKIGISTEKYYILRICLCLWWSMDLSSNKAGLLVSGLFTIGCALGLYFIFLLEPSKIFEYELFFGLFTLIIFLGFSVGAFFYYNIAIFRSLYRNRQSHVSRSALVGDQTGELP